MGRRVKAIGDCVALVPQRPMDVHTCRPPTVPFPVFLAASQGVCGWLGCIRRCVFPSLPTLVLSALSIHEKYQESAAMKLQIWLTCATAHVVKALATCRDRDGLPFLKNVHTLEMPPLFDGENQCIFDLQSSKLVLEAAGVWTRIGGR